MSAWLAGLTDAIGREGRATLVTVAAVAGSAPREPGTAMVVTRSDVVATIGGGHLEFEATVVARKALEPREFEPASWPVRFPLAATLGQCCGGVATLVFATLDASALDWLAVAARLDQGTAPFAIVSRLAGGDEASARLVLDERDAHGTLGGASLDAAAIALARERLETPPGASGQGTGIATLDATSLLVHVVRPAAFKVIVFGNGHVGRALVQVLGMLAAQVRWVDSREEAFPAQVPANVEVVASDTPASELDRAPSGAFVVVTTHSHALDLELIEAALVRGGWRYLGLIGSKSKRAQFEKRLAARGFSAEALARITCPIGTPGVRSKEPGAIAIAVAHQMLARREAITHDSGATLTSA